MRQLIYFTKLSAAGNDFIVADNRTHVVKNGAAAAKTLCDRKFSVGADGLILLESSHNSDVRMRIFNPDGSEAEMCGNGVRCLAWFSADRRITGKHMTVDTIAGQVRAQVRGQIVKARLSDPKGMKMGIKLPMDGAIETLHFVDTGVPHAVKVVGSVKDHDLAVFGPRLRNHKYFKPRGTNVDLLELTDGNAIRVATYERGVEAETLACGTGSTAAALVAASLKGLRSPVSVLTSGGETLKVYFSRKGERFTDVYLEGPVSVNFEGSVKL